MLALEECHDRGFIWKSMGMCNQMKRDVNMCLRAQRLERTKRNREEAKERSDRRKALFASIDEES